jgi:hypothetical protein
MSRVVTCCHVLPRVVTCCHAAMLTRWFIDSSSVHPVKEENVNQSWDGGGGVCTKTYKAQQGVVHS